LLAHVIVSKYVDHLPLYRQEAILGRLGWDVTRSTLCDQILACAGVLEPLYRLMCDRVRRSASLHTDDTPVPLLAPRRTAHAWVSRALCAGKTSGSQQGCGQNDFTKLGHS
jgi:hypothetical protein